MINILCSSYSFPSGRILKDLIVEKTGEKVRLTSHPEILLKRKETPSIRYGNSFGNFKSETGLNSPEFIQKCASKLAFSKLLLDAGLYTPEYSRDPKAVKEFPVLIRQSLSLSGGRGIILCKDEEEFRKNWIGRFWTKYIPTEFELRVHVLDDNIVRIFRKEQIEPTEFPIRNNETCHFSLKEPDKYPKLQSLVNSLNDVFRANVIDFGFYALDIGWDKSKKQYFIFEANSAPGLNEHTAELYTDFLLENISLEVT